jgi:hypothetical protein
MQKSRVETGPLRGVFIGNELRLIEQRLKSELETARATFEAAKQALDSGSAFARQIGLGQPDGARELLNATQEYNYRLGKYTAALKRFTKFVMQSSL